MSNFASIVRLKVKTGMNAEFERIIAEVYEKQVPSIQGRLYSRVIKTGEDTYCTFAEWESEEALANARPTMVRLLDSVRPTLAELSPELGVTDPVSGPVMLST